MTQKRVDHRSESIAQKLEHIIDLIFSDNKEKAEKEKEENRKRNRQSNLDASRPLNSENGDFEKLKTLTQRLKD
jgi:hypothetical protein